MAKRPTGPGGWRRYAWLTLGAGCLGVLLAGRLQAVIFYATADPDYNTAAPTGTLTGSGWQWVGDWRGYQGTVIGPHHFLTARHVGGTVGEVFVLNGASYPSVAFTDDTVSDLRVVEVSGTFSDWAPLYRASTEIGKTLVVFGRGWIRGAEVRDAGSNTLRGWQWTPGDGRLRWGQNTIVSTVNGGSYWGTLLYSTFDANGGVNEAHLALGDSSGPEFINEGGRWKLAGIAAVVDASFNTTPVGDGFNAALFDARGLYHGSVGNWTLVSGPTAVPSGFYATRVSARVGWIDGVVPPDSGGDGVDAPLLTPAYSLALAVVLFAGGSLVLRRNDGCGKVTR